MPWSGGVFTRTNGTYNGPTVWATDAANNVKIMSGRHDTHDQDLASGINACVAKDGSNTVTVLNLTGTVNSTSGIINVGSVVLASTYGTNNAFFGGAGNFTMSGSSNVAIGASSLISATSGGTNTAVGASSLQNNTTGTANSAVGNNALKSTTTGNFNAAFGYGAMLNNTSGGGNAAFGQGALSAGTTGDDNNAFGQGCANHVTTGSCNCAIGTQALSTITTGNYNIGIGYLADVPNAAMDGQMSIGNAIYGTGNTGTLTTVSTGNIGLYTKAPTARLHLPAGTAAANTAPLKLTAGTNLGTPENGAIEFDGSAVYITIGGVRKTFTVT